MDFTVIAAVCHVDEQKCGAIIPLFCATVFHRQAHNSLWGFGGKQKSQAIDKIIFPNIILIYKLIKDIFVWSRFLWIDEQQMIVASKHKDLWFPRRLSLQGWKNTILESRQCLQFNCGTITHAPEARDAVILYSAQEGRYSLLTYLWPLESVGFVFGSYGFSAGKCLADLDQPVGSPDANVVQTITLEAYWSHTKTRELWFSLSLPFQMSSMWVIKCIM